MRRKLPRADLLYDAAPPTLFDGRPVKRELPMADLGTAGITIFGGVTVYVIRQLLSKTSFEPLYELRMAIREVRYNLAFYGTTIHTPAGRNKDASDKAKVALMKRSSDILAKSDAIFCYEKLRFLFLLPSEQAIKDAADTLRGLSTHMHESESKSVTSDTIRKRVRRIERLLNLKSPENYGDATESSD
jgi:hypothetical protein